MKQSMLLEKIVFRYFWTLSPNWPYQELDEQSAKYLPHCNCSLMSECGSCLVTNVDTVCHKLFMCLSPLLPCPPLSSGCRHKWLVKEMFWTLERSSQLIGGHTTPFRPFARFFSKLSSISRDMAYSFHDMLQKFRENGS